MIIKKLQEELDKNEEYKDLLLERKEILRSNGFINKLQPRFEGICERLQEIDNETQKKLWGEVVLKDSEDEDIDFSFRDTSENVFQEALKTYCDNNKSRREDDKILSKGISIALEKDKHTVTVVYGYMEALQTYQKQKYDLFLLDINLPDGSGMELCKKIRETSEIPILFLTANDTEQDMLEGFGVGCDDYIPKPFSIEVLRKKVQAVLKRTGGGNSRIRYRDLDVDTDKCLVLLNGEEVHLTSTEYKLLCYLIENKGRIVTKAMLLEQLWDIDGNFVDENTVRVNIKRLRQKLNDDKQEYIVTVFGMGYTFGE